MGRSGIKNRDEYMLRFVALTLGLLTSGEIGLADRGGQLSPISCSINVLQGRGVRVTRSSLVPDESYTLEEAVLHFLSSFSVPCSNLPGSVTAGCVMSDGGHSRDGK